MDRALYSREYIVRAPFAQPPWPGDDHAILRVVPRFLIETEKAAKARIPMWASWALRRSGDAGARSVSGSAMPIALRRKPSRGARAPRTQLKEPVLFFA
jgi:hypothetical protein